MKKTPCILAFGEVLWDLLPAGPRLGGAPANVAMQAVRQGAEALLYSAVGVDERGQQALEILNQRGVNTQLMQKIPASATGTVGVTLDAAGKPTFVIHPHAAWDQVTWSEQLETWLPQLDMVYFGTLGQRGGQSRNSLQRLLKQAQAQGITRVVDINLRAPFYDAVLIRESIAAANILKLSDDELAEVAQAYGLTVQPQVVETLQALRHVTGLQLVVLTCGAKGAIAVSATEVVDQPGIPVKVVNTVGAGDAFTACLMVGLLSHHPLTQIMKHACTVSAHVCTQA